MICARSKKCDTRWELWRSMSFCKRMPHKVLPNPHGPAYMPRTYTIWNIKVTSTYRLHCVYMSKRSEHMNAKHCLSLAENDSGGSKKVQFLCDLCLLLFHDFEGGKKQSPRRMHEKSTNKNSNHAYFFLRQHRSRYAACFNISSWNSKWVLCTNSDFRKGGDLSSGRFFLHFSLYLRCKPVGWLGFGRESFFQRVKIKRDGFFVVQLLRLYGRVCDQYLAELPDQVLVTHLSLSPTTNQVSVFRSF